MDGNNGKQRDDTDTMQIVWGSRRLMTVLPVRNSFRMPRDVKNVKSSRMLGDIEGRFNSRNKILNDYRCNVIVVMAYMYIGRSITSWITLYVRSISCYKCLRMYLYPALHCVGIQK